MTYAQTSPITRIVNHFSSIALQSVLYGSIGYLGAYTVRFFDSSFSPAAGFFCGLTVGAIAGLLNANGADQINKIIAVSAIIILPQRVCSAMNVPITFEISLILSSISLGISTFAIPYFLRMFKDNTNSITFKSKLDRTNHLLQFSKDNQFVYNK